MQRLIYAQNVRPPLKGHTHTHTHTQQLLFLAPHRCRTQGGGGRLVGPFFYSPGVCVCISVSHHTTAFIRSTDVVGAEGIGGPLKLLSLIALACVCICFAPRDCIHQVQSNTVEEFLTPFYNRPIIVSPPTYAGYSCAGGVIFPLYIYASGRPQLSSKGKENINTKKRRDCFCVH